MDSTGITRRALELLHLHTNWICEGQFDLLYKSFIWDTSQYGNRDLWSEALRILLSDELGYSVRDILSDKNMDTMGSDFYYKQAELRNVTVPGNIRFIGYRAFADSIIDTVTIERGTTAVCTNAFTNCSIRKIIFPPGIDIHGITTKTPSIMQNLKSIPEIHIAKNSELYNNYQIDPRYLIDIVDIDDLRTLEDKVIFY